MSDVDYSARRRLSSVESDLRSQKYAADKTRTDLAALKGEFEKIRREQSQIITNQERMTKAIEKLTEAVEAMHAEMFPKTNNTKPALKNPAAKPG